LLTFPEADGFSIDDLKQQIKRALATLFLKRR